ncbi:sterol O-acyltransferase 2 isoform X3 [Monodon monoceros]|uniref:sterol O-acyltransferase 2 isoform X3 n=1 Tax=Monodon monoceros TaxID=40151 RepID=UPI0010F773B3|nr:sterol O-acyltransferase 2 isoform X3 [Monodon monoceros]
MEPRAAQLRRREGLGGEKEDRPSREGEPHFGNTECPGGVAGNNETYRGPDLLQWTRHMQAVKTQLLEQAQGQLTELLDQAMCEAIQAYLPQDRPVPSIPPDSLCKTREPSLGKRKVFINRKSLLDELMEVQHFRTIYHMFVAGLCVFIVSTLAIDFIDEGRLMLEFDLLIFSFGQLPLALVRLLMKSYSFLRETVPGTLRARGGEGIRAPSFSSYLYFLFCPTLIYRETYPRTPNVRWNYVAKNFAQALGCVLYACFILGRLCVPVFANMSREPFSTRALVLSIMHATLPGIFMLLLIFFAFLHCWLNAFAEMLRFGDRMFYRDWWNSTSFSNYYRTWNVVVHDWLYSYVYQDGLWLLGGQARGAAMLGVFLVSAVVHEYIFCFVLGFFYPVMLLLFLFIGGPLNFMMHDRRTGPAWNVLMWTMLFLGQGIQVSLYCQEWYAQRHCPLPQTTFWGLVTPRSWSCHT